MPPREKTSACFEIPENRQQAYQVQVVQCLFTAREVSTREPAPCNVLVPHGWLLSAADMVTAAVCTPHHASAEEPQSSLCGSYNTKNWGHAQGQ